jgi:hypothetical protein
VNLVPAEDESGKARHAILNLLAVKGRAGGRTIRTCFQARQDDSECNRLNKSWPKVGLSLDYFFCDIHKNCG